MNMMRNASRTVSQNMAGMATRLIALALCSFPISNPSFGSGMREMALRKIFSSSCGVMNISGSVRSLVFSMLPYNSTSAGMLNFFA